MWTSAPAGKDDTLLPVKARTYVKKGGQPMNGTKKIKTPTTTRGMLNLIDKFLARCDGESGNLWDVLSALRGPDDGDEITKKRTTLLIRAAAFPKLKKALDKRKWISGPSNRYPGMNGDPPYDPTGDDGHFYTHANGAAKVLNLR